MSYEEADRLHEVIKKRSQRADHLNHFVTLHLDPNAPVENVVEEFRKAACIEKAGLIPRLSGSAPPLNDRFLGEDEEITTIGTFENQWYIFRCHADKAWPIATGSGVTITVIDEGFDADHEDLKPNVDLVFNSTTNNDQISTPNSGSATQINHGTGCAGFAAAAGNNNVGIAGFAYQSKLRLVQAFKDASSNDPNVPKNNISGAISWATQQATSGRHVVTISLGVGDAYNTIPVDAASGSGGGLGPRELIDVAIAHNIVVCIAAGNFAGPLGQDLSTNQNGVPFTGSEAIVVGATRKNEHAQDVPSNTNWGSRMAVCAPGDINHDMTCSSKPDKYTYRFGGASMLQANPSLTPAQVKAILNGTGKPLDKMYGTPFGPMLDTFAAVTAAQVPATGSKLVANRFLNFGTAERGTPSAALTVNVFNIGVAGLNLTSLGPKPGSSSDFKISAQPAIPGPAIAPGGSTTIGITFTPSSHNDVDATFLLASDSPGPPLEIQCTGTAPWTLGEKFKLGGEIAGGVAGGALVVYLILHYWAHVI